MIVEFYVIRQTEPTEEVWFHLEISVEPIREARIQLKSKQATLTVNDRNSLIIHVQMSLNKTHVFLCVLQSFPQEVSLVSVGSLVVLDGKLILSLRPLRGWPTL